MKCFFALISILVISLSTKAQLDITFDLSDNNKRVNCYTPDKPVSVSFFVDQNNGCIGTCYYIWDNGENEKKTNKNSNNVTFNYTSDGEFKPSLIVIDDNSFPDSVKTSEITRFEKATLNGNSVDLIVNYKTINGIWIDTLSISTDQIDTAQASNAASKIQVYSPINGVPNYEVSESPNAVEKPNYPFPGESYLLTLRPDDSFSPFDADVWVYHWDFGHPTPPDSDGTPKEMANVSTKSDTIDHLFPHENLEGFKVRLTISLDSTKFTSNFINTYKLAGCYSTEEFLVPVEDKFFGNTSNKENISERKAFVANTFTPNDDDINEVFTFSTSGQHFFTVKIFNRWSNLVYEQSGYTIAWDGKTNGGGLCNSGVYYFVITSDADDERHNTNGYINLFRE
ncbi:MAG: gliding motility-associated C-terminal domain-containing protein [Bacteroidales bacterium]|nr:gliding motility-associated C-terminal domain-containing protein [Bacteroidales bacterium]